MVVGSVVGQDAQPQPERVEIRSNSQLLRRTPPPPIARRVITDHELPKVSEPPEEAPGRGGLRRPQPHLKTRPEKSTETVQAEEWMDKRLANLTLEMFGTDGLVVFSTYLNLEPPPAFRHVWHSISQHNLQESLTPEVSRQLESANVVLVFSDTRSKEHTDAAYDLAESICDVGAAAPPVILLPHSTSPELRSEIDDAKQVESEFLILSAAFDNCFDAVICGEPSGIKLACEVSSRFRMLTRNANIANKKVTEHRRRLKYMGELEDNIDEIVWDYLRLRLRTGIPQVNYDVEPGLPSRVDGYFVSTKLGEGSFGTVHRLMRPGSVRSDEVLKVVDKGPITNYRGIASLKRQIGVMRTLSTEPHAHPNIVKLYEVYHTETHLLFRMEYAGPQDLFKRLLSREESDMPLGVDKVAGILAQCLAGLCHLHLKPRLVHRDLKPENIIVAETADNVIVKLTDFDTAAVAPTGTLCHGIIGTFPFVAPEVIIEEKYDPFPADVWSMAGVFLEVVCRLRIISKMLRVPTPRGAREQQSFGYKIRVVFQKEDFVKAMLVKHIRSELHTMLSDGSMLLEGMLNVGVDQRWTAKAILEASRDSFAGGALAET